MTSLDNVKNWIEFVQNAESVSEKERGDLFEILTKYYLLIEPTYTTKLTDVWLWSEIPTNVKELLGLPTRDMGIDIVARTKTGKYWAVQCKYRSNKNGSLTWREISTFAGLSLIRDRFELCLLAYTGSKYSEMLKQAEEGRVGLLSSDTWEQLDEVFFNQLHDFLKGGVGVLESRRPRPHQQRAIENAKRHFIESMNVRGKLIMPCGAGKSLTAFWIAETLGAKTIVVAVPSLALIQQILPDWLREYKTRGEDEKLHWLCVCSDKTVTHDIDSLVVHTHDMGFPCSTDTEQIRKWLQDTTTAAMRVIFTTYQSGEILAAAVRSEKIKIDLGIMDEAHKTVGRRGKLFTHLLFEENISIKHRLFMTATERQFADKSDDIVSMDDVAIYGDTFEHLSFRSALEQGILSDYRIITRIVSSTDVEDRVKKNTLLHSEQNKIHEVEAQMLASAITLVKSSQRLPIKHSVSFHSSISKASTFKDLFADTYKNIEPESETTQTFHVSGKTPAGERKRTIKEFAMAPRALITNARCLTEGVDVPNIDCVLFADPRKSKVDIVQAVGRALRRAKDKECGYILVPVISHGEPPNVFVESAAFAAVIDVIRALAVNDERIIDYFEAKREGRKPEVEMIETTADEQITEAFDIKEFEEHIGIKVWEKIMPLSRRYLPYDEATQFVHTLGIKRFKNWFKYVRGECSDLTPKPENITSTPNHFYSDFSKRGGWRAWLGEKSRTQNYCSYEDAIQFVHPLKLKGVKEWWLYRKSRAKPNYIPGSPEKVYQDFYERGGISGWLGTGRIPPSREDSERRRAERFLPYHEAVKFVRSLGLENNKGWIAYLRSGKKPDNIPSGPIGVYGKEYKNGGGQGAWLGTKLWRRKNEQKIKI